MGEALNPSLIEVVRLAEARCENVLSLFELLQPADGLLREAVLEILVVRGFEVGGALPNLQLPQDLAEELDLPALAEAGQLHQALSLAGKSGMLVDLSDLGSDAWNREPHGPAAGAATQGNPRSRSAFLGD